MSTEGGARTHTVLPPLDFESSASTNSATSAHERRLICRPGAKIRLFPFIAREVGLGFATL
jgi:hypothetical protein